MIEEEAKTKWCPFARVVGLFSEYGAPQETLASGNRFGAPHTFAPPELQQATRCIASECMAWRWSRKDFRNLPREEWYGYCGLAGEG